MVELSLANVDVGGVEDFDESVVDNPNVGNAWATFGVNQVVGNGSRTSDMCGKYLHVRGCVRTDLHEGKKWFGEDCTDKVYVHVVHHCCHRPSCPVCYEGWAAREGERAEARLAEAEKRFRVKAEHFIVSFGPERYGACLEDMRSFCKGGLFSRGVFGGCMIFHGFRYNRFRRVWFWSPHFHVVGFLKGGYGRCRACRKQFCSGCDGFEGKTRRCFQKDGMIVKVAQNRESGVSGERRSLFETVRYQLSHASIRTDVKRPHALTWFGVCSYRELRFRFVKKKVVCPICGSELVKMYHLGVRSIVRDKSMIGYLGEFLDDIFDGNGVNWVVVGSGSYGQLR